VFYGVNSSQPAKSPYLEQRRVGCFFCDLTLLCATKPESFFDGTRRSSPFALIEREKLYKGIARERITEKRGTKI
jgi:hypothetical protein